MSVQGQSSPYDVVGVGIAFSLGGLYFILAALDVLPMPSHTDGPPALIVCAGAAFLFGGLTCFVRAKAGMDEKDSDVPDSAPRWTQAAYRALAIGMAGALALIGTWIAIGSGPRAFTFSAPFVEMQTAGEAIGRTVFGLGSVIAWIYVIALTVGTVRKFWPPRLGPPQP